MKNTRRLSILVPSLSILLAVACAAPAKRAETPAPGATPPSAHKTAIRTEGLEPYSCGTIERLHTYQGLFLASQPAADDLRHAREGGIKTVLDLRAEGELKEFDEPALVKELGMEYVNLGFRGPDTLSDDLIDKARALLADPARRPMMVHCHSGNRVGAIWLAHRVLDGGQTFESALAEAHEVGLKAPALETRVRTYVETRRN